MIKSYLASLTASPQVLLLPLHCVASTASGQEVWILYSDGRRNSGSVGLDADLEPSQVLALLAKDCRQGVARQEGVACTRLAASTVLALEGGWGRGAVVLPD